MFEKKLKLIMLLVIGFEGVEMVMELLLEFI